MTAPRLFPPHSRLQRPTAAWAELITAITDPTPCLDQPWWTSEDPDFQALAAAACLDCPVLALCRDYGLEHHKELGVYGGLTEKDRRAARRAARKQLRKEAS